MAKPLLLTLDSFPFGILVGFSNKDFPDLQEELKTALTERFSTVKWNSKNSKFHCEDKMYSCAYNIDYTLKFEFDVHIYELGPKEAYKHAVEFNRTCHDPPLELLMEWSGVIHNIINKHLVSEFSD